MSIFALAMLILIAESKTMTACGNGISAAELHAHRPALDAGATAIMDRLRALDAPALAKAVKISQPMAASLARMIYDFPDKRTGACAIEAYTGVVFKAFSYASLDAAARRCADRMVRIISSLYGWLRPCDIIKPYRLDFTTRLAPGDTAFANYWRSDVTGLLLGDLAAGPDNDVLDLLPGDALRCLDLKRLAGHAQIWHVEFAEVQPGGAYRTPNANLLKTLRGKLLRHIVSHGITTPAEVAAITTDDFMPEPSATPHTIRFITA